MKTLIMTLIAATFALQAQAKPHTLTCYEVAGSKEKPLMTATLVSDTTLRDIKINAPEGHEDIKGQTTIATGTMVVSNHSPYKGDIQYSLSEGLTLLLPASLANSDLEESLEDGIGYGKQENGVIIGFYQGDGDGGNHFSFRMKCNSDK